MTIEHLPALAFFAIAILSIGLFVDHVFFLPRRPRHAGSARVTLRAHHPATGEIISEYEISADTFSIENSAQIGGHAANIEDDFTTIVECDMPARFPPAMILKAMPAISEITLKPEVAAQDILGYCSFRAQLEGYGEIELEFIDADEHGVRYRVAQPGKWDFGS